MADPVAAAADAVSGAGGLQALAASPSGIGALAVWDEMDGSAHGRPSRGRPKGARNRPKDFLGLIPALIGERFGELPGEEDKPKDRGRKSQAALSEDVALKREQIEKALLRLRALLDEGEDIKEKEQARLTGRIPLARAWRESSSLVGDASMLGDLSGAASGSSLAFALNSGGGLAGMEPSGKRRRLGDEDSVEVSALGSGSSSSSASGDAAAGAASGRGMTQGASAVGVLQQTHPQRCPIASGFATLYSLPSGTLLAVEFPGMSYAASSAAAAAGGAGVLGAGAGAGLLPGAGSAGFGGAAGGSSSSSGSASITNGGPAAGPRPGAAEGAVAADVMSSAAVAALHNAFKRP